MSEVQGKRTEGERTKGRCAPGAWRGYGFAPVGSGQSESEMHTDCGSVALAVLSERQHFPKHRDTDVVQFKPH